MIITDDSISKSVAIYVKQDAGGTNPGEPATGLTNTNITSASYWRQGGTRTAITTSALATVGAAYSSGGIIEVDATNMPGVYRFDVPNAALASGADWAVVQIVWTGASNAVSEPLLIELTIASAADINAEVVDVMKTDTVTLPGQGAPTATPTMEAILGYLYKAFRNRKAQTATTWSLYADDETTVDQKATVSDDGTTAIKQEVVTGP